MRLFFCAGEPSGDLHGANLVAALRRLRPDVECVGYGGEHMEAAGCRLLYPLCQLAVLGFLRVLPSLHTFLRLLIQADRFFQRQRPDAVVLIDLPGFNWWLARRAQAHGIPVLYFVPPQLWAWGGWRVRKMQRWVDHVLCTLPFEPAWYHARGVPAHYVGHPYFDALPQQHLDAAFLAEQQARPATLIGLLPGSRSHEVERNLATLVRTAVRIHAARPDTRFLIACYKPAHQQRVQEYLRGRGLPYLEPCVGRTPEIIHLAQACVAVSGSVGLELLYRGKPSVVVYRISQVDVLLCRLFQQSRYISLVNLLADKELFPEFLTPRCEAATISDHILRWLKDAAAYEGVCAELRALREQVAKPGACERAAQYLLAVLEPRVPSRRRPAA